jgi:hypothetical protein
MFKPLRVLTSCFSDLLTWQSYQIMKLLLNKIQITETKKLKKCRGVWSVRPGLPYPRISPNYTRISIAGELKGPHDEASWATSVPRAVAWNSSYNICAAICKLYSLFLCIYLIYIVRIIKVCLFGIFRISFRILFLLYQLTTAIFIEVSCLFCFLLFV